MTMENNALLVSPSPHVRARNTTRGVMLDVLIALCPALIASVFVFGWRAMAVVALCVSVCVVSEWLFELICKRPVTVGDLSAAVTGVILACNLPSTIPLWQAAVGSVVAIVVVKQLFGGIGCNFANPAATARIVMLISFASSMSSFSTKADALSTATPLSGGPMPSYIDLFLGNHGGSLGETCALAIILGFAYLLIRRVISAHAPLAFVGTVFLFSLALGEDPVAAILTGGVMFGAVFMATDYTTTPQRGWGKIIFGVGCGVITVLIRVFGNYPEGVTFSILLMNILTPYISVWTRKKPFGGVKK